LIRIFIYQIKEDFLGRGGLEKKPLWVPGLKKVKEIIYDITY